MSPDAQIAALTAALETRTAYASGIESQLTVALGERDAARSQIAGLTAERDAAVAAAPPSGSVIPVTEFRRRIVPAYMAVDTVPLPAAQRAMWVRVLDLIGTWTTINLADPNTTTLMDMAVADGLLTQQHANAALGK